MQIDDQIAFYRQIPNLAALWQTCGVHTAHLLDPTHPSYFSDAVALRCLQTFHPTESDHQALERCLTDQLHHVFTCMDQADPTQVLFLDHIWEQFPFDSALRLAWRLRDKTVVFYLENVNNTQLVDEFHLTVCDHEALLACTNCGRQYTIPADCLQDLDAFQEAVCQHFRLATEERGYFVPAYVWLACEEKE